MATVAAVQGHAFGAGAMLATSHDFRVMRADRGFYCLPEVQLNMPFTVGMYGADPNTRLPQPDRGRGDDDRPPFRRPRRARGGHRRRDRRRRRRPRGRRGTGRRAHRHPRARTSPAIKRGSACRPRPRSPCRRTRRTSARLTPLAESSARSGMRDWSSVNADTCRRRDQAAQTDLIALSHSIHAEPELAFEEYRSAAKIIDAARRSAVSRSRRASRTCRPPSMPGSAAATWSSVSAPSTTRCPEIGHACGHNIIAASAVGAGSRSPRRRPARHHRAGASARPPRRAAAARCSCSRRGVFDDVGGGDDGAPRTRSTSPVRPRSRWPTSPSPSPAARRTPRPRRNSGATPPTPRPSPRSASACCASTCYAGPADARDRRPTAAPRPTSCPRTPRCCTTCAPSTAWTRSTT